RIAVEACLVGHATDLPITEKPPERNRTQEATEPDRVAAGLSIETLPPTETRKQQGRSRLGCTLEPSVGSENSVEMLGRGSRLPQMKLGHLIGFETSGQA